jgi:hypothetical protein
MEGAGGRVRWSSHGRLDELLARTGGILTPALEGTDAAAFSAGLNGRKGGLDWGNLQVVFPCRFWRGSDPRLRPSLDLWSSRLMEGLYPYPFRGNGNLVHHYLTTSLAHALLESGSDGDREHLFAILYDGLLGHATPMHGGCELLDLATHDVWPHDNTAPHNTFSARYLLLLRDLLVAERGDTLMLGAGLSPAWLEPGGRMAIEGTATRFGWVDAAIDAEGDGQGTVSLEVAVSVHASPPARRSAGPGRRARIPVNSDCPPADLAAIGFRAPLGYRIEGVTDWRGRDAGVLRANATDLLMGPGTYRFTVELRGASDPRWSAAAASRRLLSVAE